MTKFQAKKQPTICIEKKHNLKYINLLLCYVTGGRSYCLCNNHPSRARLSNYYPSIYLFLWSKTAIDHLTSCGSSVPVSTLHKTLLTYLPSILVSQRPKKNQLKLFNYHQFNA